MTKKKHAKIIIKNRARFLVVMTVLMLAVLSLLSLWHPWSASGLENREVLTVVVGPQDTLWELSKDYYGNQLDPREGVFTIKSYNNLPSSEIYPGQTLLIPL